jgi:bifunctional DNA-binding transcriptional regulator/antitoxin component of YhaV-PrlF toxin-antitoxin module
MNRNGEVTVAEIKKVDAQGRVALPAKWRARKLRDTDEVVLVEKGEVLLLKPRVKPDLTKHFDMVDVDIDPKAFSDYSKLKKTILGRSRE